MENLPPRSRDQTFYAEATDYSEPGNKPWLDSHYYFKGTHFEPTFFPVSPGKWRLVSFLNGCVFPKWSILATKKA
jgi:hypothetical protein